MSTIAPPPPPRSEDPHDAEALEALIEEARQRTRRRRRKYAAAALAAGLVGAYGLSNIGGDDTRSSDRGELAAAAAGAGAQISDGKWRVASGLEGGQIAALAVDPQHPKTVFAGTWEAGVFKSDDGGRRWRHMDVGSEVSRVDALAIAAGEPDTVYVGTGRGVFKTTNGGRSWDRTSAGILGKETAAQRGYRPSGGYVSALIVDPRDADVAYAGTRENGLFKTEDGGGSWRRVGPRSEWFRVNTLTSVKTLTFEPGNPRVIYASFTRGVYRSGDGGATWQPAGLRSVYVTALAVDAKHPQTIYAGSYEEKEPDIVTGRIFKTTDGGASWRRTKGVRGVTGAIAIDPHNTDVVYAQAGGDVVKSADGGRTWRSLGPGLEGSPVLALDPRNPETIYLGDTGVAKSVDGGRRWRRMNAGLTTARVSALAVAPGARSGVYAAILWRGIFKRVSGTWRPANVRVTTDAVPIVWVDPRNPANVYASMNGGVFRSASGGATWRESPLPAPFGEGGDASALAVDPTNSRTVYALAARDDITGDGLRESYESAVMKSMDGGRTWPTVARVRAEDFPVAPAASAVFTWGVSPPLVIDPRDPRVLYAGGRGISKSSDGGVTWRSSGLGRTPVLAVAVDPSEAGTLYAGTNAGVLKSTNAGATWQRLHGALDGARVRALAIDPQHHRTVFAGTESSVFWSTDGGLSWHRFTGLPHRPFHALAVDRSAGLLYAGADGGGIFELKLGR